MEALRKVKYSSMVGVLAAVAALAWVARGAAQETFAVGVGKPGHVLFAGVGAGLPGGPMMGDGPAAVLPLLMQAGDLSDEQRAQIDTILQGQRAALEPQFTALSSLNRQLGDKLLSPGDLSQDDVAALVQQIVDARAALIQNGIKVALQVRGVLTSDQLAKVASARQRLDALDAERRQILGDDVVFLRN
jgi:Spy/CpxP family protein refolding chaperone